MKSSRQDNRIVVDLRKVSYARFWYENQYGQRRDMVYKDYGKIIFSVRNEWHNVDELGVGSGKNLLEYAKEKGLLDVWTPTLYLQLTASHSLTYTGPKALQLWEAWRARVFGPDKKKG